MKRTAVAIGASVLVIGAFVSSSGASAQDPPICGDPNVELFLATLVGTPGPDVLIGTPGRDVIVGFAGDDRISGLNGNDVICGDEGNDVIEGGTGNDLLIGDSAEGGPPPFADSNGSNDDVIRGGGGNDTLAGLSGDDTLDGGSGNDTIIGFGGEDDIDAGSGNDTAFGGPRNDVLRGGTGNDDCGATSVAMSSGVRAETTSSTVTTRSRTHRPRCLNSQDGPDTCSGGTGNNTVVNCETHPSLSLRSSLGGASASCG